MSIVKNEKHSIGDLLSCRNPFVIPKYQRAYSWGQDEVEAFCDDIREIKKEYFFGGIVSVYEHYDNTPGRIYRIVDGQQRLATFTILLYALKEAFIEVANNTNDNIIQASSQAIAEQIVDCYLTYRDTRKKPPQNCNRLKLSNLDNKYFEDMLNNKKLKELAESHKRLKRAREIIEEKLIRPILRKQTEQERIEELEKLKDNILEKSIIIHIVCSDVDDAYQLFEVLNDRGKDLAICDYLRSSTLELISGEDTDSEEEEACLYWDKIQSKKDTDSYIKNYLRSYEGTIKRSQVHKQVQKVFFKTENITTDEIIERIKNIYDQYKVYESISNGEWPYIDSKVTQWDKNRLYLLIHDLKHTLCIPLLLAIQEIGEESDFNLAIQYIEKTVFKSITILGHRANKLSDLYSKTIKDIRSKNNFDIDNFTKELKNYMKIECDEESFKKELHKKLVYDKNNINRIKYFLMTIESYYKWYKKSKKTNDNIPQPATNIILTKDATDIEHIYSQGSNNKDEDIEEIKNTLGNLTLLEAKDNRALGNKDFEEKKEEYRHSEIGITKDIGNEIDSWDVDAIAKREDLYCEIASLVFDLNLYK